MGVIKYVKSVEDSMEFNFDLGALELEPLVEKYGALKVIMELKKNMNENYEGDHLFKSTSKKRLLEMQELYLEDEFPELWI